MPRILGVLPVAAKAKSVLTALLGQLSLAQINVAWVCTQGSLAHYRTTHTLHTASVQLPAYGCPPVIDNISSSLALCRAWSLSGWLRSMWSVRSSFNDASLTSVSGFLSRTGTHLLPTSTKRATCALVGALILTNRALCVLVSTQPHIVASNASCRLQHAWQACISPCMEPAFG